MSLEGDRCIISFRDIGTTRLIMKCIAEKDANQLAALSGVKLTKDEHFWPSLEGCGVAFEEPPSDFFVLWHMQFDEQKNILSLEGPMWVKDEGPSNWYLYLEKYVNHNPPFIYIKAYGNT
jgi:hypothetical protein